MSAKIINISDRQCLSWYGMLKVQYWTHPALYIHNISANYRRAPFYCQYNSSKLNDYVIASLQCSIFSVVFFYSLAQLASRRWVRLSFIRFLSSWDSDPSNFWSQFGWIFSHKCSFTLWKFKIHSYPCLSNYFNCTHLSMLADASEWADPNKDY